MGKRDKLFSPSHLGNRARAIADYRRGAAETAAMPAEIVIEVTSYCNLACPMCARVSKTTPNVYMEPGLFRSIVDQVKGFAELVCLGGGVGEPLAHPKIGDMIAYCRESGVPVMMSSNATLLNAKKTEAVLESGLDILVLSLDGASKETHEAIRVGSDFEKTMANVETFLAEKVRRKLTRPTTILQMIYMPANRHEAEAFYRKWRSVAGADFVRTKKMNALLGAELQPEAMAAADESLSCLYPWRQLSIAADGKIALCCRDLNFMFPLGSLAERPIAEIWNAPEFQEARRKLASGRKAEIALCAGCDTMKTSLATRLALRVLDDRRIHMLAPLAEKTAMRLGFRLW